MALITGTHHVALKCKDEAQFEEVLNFYGNILGMPVVRTWGEGSCRGAMLDTGNSMMEIFAAGAVTDSTGSINHFALGTEDTDACVAAASAAGYKVKMEPTDIVIGSVPPYPARVAFVYGPCGEEIEFFCVK